MKWTITMTQEELIRKTIIEQANDKRITQREGAERLGISERHFRRILARYRTIGDAGLVSGHRNKPSNNRLGEASHQEIVAFINDPLYYDFGPTLLNEKLEERIGISISTETMRQIMIKEGLHKPKVKRNKKPHPPRERRMHPCPKKIALVYTRGRLMGF